MNLNLPLPTQWGHSQTLIVLLYLLGECGYLPSSVLHKNKAEMLRAYGPSRRNRRSAEIPAIEEVVDKKVFKGPAKVSSMD